MCWPCRAGAESVTNTTAQLVRFLEDRLKGDPDDFLTAGKLAHTYLQSGRETGSIADHPRAVRLFREALVSDPDSYPLRAGLGAALVTQHRFAEAAKLAKRLVAEHPSAAAGYGVLGDALLELGDAAGAAKAYAELVELNPGLAAYSRLAKVDWIAGKIPSALSNVSRALLFSNSPPEALAWAHVQKGELHFRSGQFPQAEAEYRAALRILPGYYLAEDHLAELRATEGKFDEAARVFEQLAVRTQRPEYWQAVGDVHVAARHREKAKAWHDRALAAYLKDAEAGGVHYFHHLAGFYADVRENAIEAEKWARRDLEIRQNIYAWDALGWALFWKEDYSGAVSAMEKALVTGTQDAQVLAHAGSIFVRGGNISKGKALMKRASEINPRFGDFHVHR